MLMVDKPTNQASMRLVTTSSRRFTLITKHSFLHDERVTDTDALEPLSLDGDALDPIDRGGALIGYARISTRDQNLDRRPHALKTAGYKKTFADKKSGKNAEREELAACLNYIRAGDTLMVTSPDRLGRSLQDLITIVAGLRRLGRVHPETDRRRHLRGPGRRTRPRTTAGQATDHVHRADPTGPHAADSSR